jgi:hypothetical protein
MAKCKSALGIFFFLTVIGIAPSYAGKPELDAEATAQLSNLEDSMMVMADSMMYTPIPDFRIDYCVRFTRFLRTALETPNSFDYPFTRLASKIHILYSEDKTFRIFNWLIAPTTEIRRYYGAIQMDSEQPKYYPLLDAASELGNDVATMTLDNKHWYGNEIYRIMDQNVNGRKMYLLFGFSSNGANSNKKLIDVLNINDGGVTFGAPVFALPNQVTGRMEKPSRVILEYKKTAQVYLNYDAEKKLIVFNRIASEVTEPNRKGTYIPTGQMDGLKWENGMYQYVRDAIPVLRLQDGQAPIDGVMK